MTNPNPWQQAVLDECMRIEGCYKEADPSGTLACLIDWHLRNSTDAARLSWVEDALRRDLIRLQLYVPGSKITITLSNATSIDVREGIDAMMASDK